MDVVAFACVDSGAVRVGDLANKIIRGAGINISKVVGLGKVVRDLGFKCRGASAAHRLGRRFYGYDFFWVGSVGLRRGIIRHSGRRFLRFQKLCL